MSIYIKKNGKGTYINIYIDDIHMWYGEEIDFFFDHLTFHEFKN